MPATRSYTTICPDCSAPIAFEPRPRVGQRHECAQCGSEMEVISLTPLELDWAMDSADWGALDTEDLYVTTPEVADPLSKAVAGALETQA
jgi:lysine biosynthesis protein LysW